MPIIPKNGGRYKIKGKIFCAVLKKKRLPQEGTAQSVEKVCQRADFFILGRKRWSKYFGGFCGRQIERGL